MILALDYDRARDACALARSLRGLVGWVKVGNQLFTAEGPTVVERLARMGYGVFLDLKFHDIPSTVAGAVGAAARLRGVRLLTLHVLGGVEMMRAARKAVGGMKNPPKLLGVTVLTSHDAASLRRIGVAGPPASRAVKLARLAKDAGLDGVVASAHEVRAIRRACGPKFLIVVPGIRPTDSATNDQSRVATPADAIRAGASYLVVGRPITGAENPREAASHIVQEISFVLS
ncbi:MAG: orotidine-5'-phosphate decarboxylase [Candidatus Acidiferrales bacterium]